MSGVHFPHGALSGNEVLIDLLRDNQRRLSRTLQKINDDALYWTPTPGLNSIALTLWHMGRLFDVFLRQNIQGLPAGREIWLAEGWAQRTGYDPRGTGMNGWGTVNAYSAEEIAALPTFTRAQLVTYLEQVYAAAELFLQTTPMSTLSEAAPGMDGQFTKYQLMTMALMDNVRHLGEIMALSAWWLVQQE